MIHEEDGRQEQEGKAESSKDKCSKLAIKGSTSRYSLLSLNLSFFFTEICILVDLIMTPALSCQLRHSRLALNCLYVTCAFASHFASAAEQLIQFSIHIVIVLCSPEGCMVLKYVTGTAQ